MFFYHNIRQNLHISVLIVCFISNICLPINKHVFSNLKQSPRILYLSIILECLKSTLVVANRVVKEYFVVMLNIRKVLIASAEMHGVVHSQDMHSHHVDHLYLSIDLRLGCIQFGQFGVHHQA